MARRRDHERIADALAVAQIQLDTANETLQRNVGNPASEDWARECLAVAERNFAAAQALSDHNRPNRDPLTIGVTTKSTFGRMKIKLVLHDRRYQNFQLMKMG
jgi:hypothetical protein